MISPAQGAAETEQKLNVLKNETRGLFEKMKHIMAAQSLQVQTCMRDIERVESHLDGLRTTSSHREGELDLAKKVMLLERDIHQLTKEHKKEIHELRQNLKDADLVLKNVRHQVESAYSSNEFKA